MPLKHQPVSLRTASLVAIANNFEQICYGKCTTEDMIRLLNNDEYLDVEGPFAEMPVSILEDLCEQLKHVTHLRRQHLHMLLYPQISAWSSHGIGDLQIAFTLVATRCQTLRRLNISYLRHMGPNALISLLPCFTTLVSLNLQMTLTVDQILGEIGRRCINLVDLNLAMTPITDKGLIQLCVAPDGTRLCQKLQRLAISETYATVAGAIIVLQSLPKLREFDFEKIFQALEQISIWSHDLEIRLLCGAGVRLNSEASPAPERLCLTTLVSTTEDVPLDGIDAAARLCFDARSIVLSNAWLPSEALYKFMLMDQLTSISLTNCDGLTLDFHDGVLPLLAVCGSRLENLILTNFTVVDITHIGQSCFGLKNLALSNIATYEFTGPPNRELFKHLRALELWTDPHAFLNPTMIRQMLIFCPDITNVLFKGCEVLTDKFIADLLVANPMNCLSHITMDHCHGVSAAALHQLLDAENVLTVIRIWNCRNITKVVNTEIRNRIRNQNMDIYLEWFQYDE